MGLKVTCGTDIIEISRIKECIERLGDKFLSRIYTEKEREYCEDKRQMKYQHYAARFAAKEAVFKAVSCYLDDRWTISWHDVEILNDESGRPNLIFPREIQFKNIRNIDVSLSHSKEYVVATVVVMAE